MYERTCPGDYETSWAKRPLLHGKARHGIISMALRSDGAKVPLDSLG